MDRNPYTAAMAYRRTSATVPPAIAVVKLYDGAILRIHRAIVALEDRKLDDSFSQIISAVSILRGLSYTLDFERGGELASRLRRMYSRNIMALLRSVGKPDAAERYRKIAAGLKSLRDAWEIVANRPLEDYRKAAAAAS
ncbi:MAG TPA: flagellar export chaperone FliS [Bradyrhizobium sp.]|nr:flagellar export chaperone FliS [Bradyrhizobium sp.]